jgi:ferric-dicitrate binding protein FerR (iron transport regulator)
VAAPGTQLGVLVAEGRLRVAPEFEHLQRRIRKHSSLPSQEVTMSTTSGARPWSQAPSSARLWRAGLLAAAAATLINVLAWVVVQQLGDAG